MACAKVAVAVDESRAITWDAIPNELLRMIFMKLDCKALMICLFVNEKWKIMAREVAGTLCLWPELINTGFYYGARNLLERSLLSPRLIIDNYMLWFVIKKARLQIIHAYFVVQFRNMTVNEDQLIVNTGSDLMYHDIDTFEIFPQLELDTLIFEQNDFIIVRLDKEKKGTKTEPPPGDLYLMGREVFRNVIRIRKVRAAHYGLHHVTHFKISNNVCFALTVDNFLWACIYSIRGWRKELIARYYGPDNAISVIHVFNEKVYIATKAGDIMVGVSAEVGFKKVWHVDLPQNSKIVELFHDCDVVISVPGENDSMKVVNNKELKRMQILCTNLSCTWQYGLVLFLGFKSGKVFICLPWKMRLNPDNAKPERIIDVNDISEEKIAPAIYDIKVCERKHSHILFIATSCFVFQVLLTYPGNGSDIFDFKTFNYLYRHMATKFLGKTIL